MKAKILPNTLPKRSNAKKDGTVEAESSMKIRQARNCRVRLYPVDRWGAVQAGVVIFAGPTGPKGKEECDGDADEERPARALPFGANAAPQ